MKARLAIGLVGLAALAAPASSQAVDYYAADAAAAGSPDCLSAANACTIATALDKVDDAPATADVLHLAAGNYNGGAEDKLDINGAGFDGLVVQGAGRDQTTLNQNPAALGTSPFETGGLSGGQTIKDLTLKAATNSTAARTLDHSQGSLTLEDVDLVGPASPTTHFVIIATGQAPELALKGVHVTYVPAGPFARALEILQNGATGTGKLTVEDSSIDLTYRPNAIGLLILGNVQTVIRRSAIRMRRASGVTDDSHQSAIYVNGSAQAAATPSFSMSDSAIVGGAPAVFLAPHPNQPDYKLTATIERSSIDGSDVGVADGSSNSADVRAGAFVAGQSLPLTLRDNVIAGAIAVGQANGGTLALTCASNFIGDPAASSIMPLSGACAETNTSSLAAALPDLSGANALDTSLAPGAALAKAFCPGPQSVLLDTATGIGAAATDAAGLPRNVDADDADSVAQVDRGAYERQTLATAGSCPPPPPVTTNPADLSVNAGQSAAFTVSASGDPAPRVQWQSKAPGAAGFSDISGETSATLTLANVTAAQNGTQVRAVVSNAGGQATSAAATLTVNTPSPPPPPPGSGAGAAPKLPLVPVKLPDTTAPALSGLKVPGKVKRGKAVKIALSSSEAATVKIVITRKATGVRKGRKCVAGTPGGKKKACQRTVSVKTLTRTVGAGASSITLGTKKLPVGSLRLSITATDAAGNTSRATTKRLTVAKR